MFASCHAINLHLSFEECIPYFSDVQHYRANFIFHPRKIICIHLYIRIVLRSKYHFTETSAVHNITLTGQLSGVRRSSNHRSENFVMPISVYRIFSNLSKDLLIALVVWLNQSTFIHYEMGNTISGRSCITSKPCKNSPFPS